MTFLGFILSSREIRPDFPASPSIISLVLNKEIPECPHAGNICRSDSSRNSFATDFNNLRGAALASALPIQNVKSQRLLLDVSVLARRYVDDSSLRSHAESVVSRAALQQRPQLGGFPAFCPVAGTWLIEGRVMNTASVVIDGSIASPKFGRMRITSSSTTVEAWIPSEIGAISPLVDWLMQFIERSRCAAGNEPSVELALREALNNAVLHGNRMDAHKLVEVCCRCEWGKGVWLIIKDQGDGFDPNAVPNALAPDRLEAEHGRGICLMRSSMDQVLFERGGTEVRMWKGPAVRNWRRKASPWRS